MTRPERVRPAPATAPTQLEMSAPVLPGQVPPPAAYPAGAPLDQNRPFGSPPAQPGPYPRTPPPGPYQPQQVPPGHLQSPYPGQVPVPQLPPGAVPTGPPGSHPLSIYDTPMPVGLPPAPGWEEDSSEILRQGVSRNRPGLATPAPGPYGPGASDRTVPPRVLVTAFLVAVAIGFTITLIIGKLAT